MKSFKKQLVPVGRLLGTFSELHAAGCIQTGADVTTNLDQAQEKFGQIFTFLKVELAGNICDGCPAFNNGSCKAFKLYHTSVWRPLVQVEPQKKLSEPIRKIAKRLGISINEVQRRRDRGELL